MRERAPGAFLAVDAVAEHGAAVDAGDAELDLVAEAGGGFGCFRGWGFGGRHPDRAGDGDDGFGDAGDEGSRVV